MHFLKFHTESLGEPWENLYFAREPPFEKVWEPGLDPNSEHFEICTQMF